MKKSIIFALILCALFCACTSAVGEMEVTYKPIPSPIQSSIPSPKQSSMPTSLPSLIASPSSLPTNEPTLESTEEPYYSFSIDEETVDVMWHEEGSVSIIYNFIFENDEGSPPIDFVDIYIPSENYSIQNVSAFVNDQEINHIKESSYISGAIELGLENDTIMPGESGHIIVKIEEIWDLINSDPKDEKLLKIVFSPTWFDSDFVHGATDYTVTVHMPNCIKPDTEAIFSSPSDWITEPLIGEDEEKHVTYTWENPDSNSFTAYKFGASIPKACFPQSAYSSAVVDLQICADTTHFFVYCADQDIDVSKDVASLLEQEYESITSNLDFTPTKKSTVNIYPNLFSFHAATNPAYQEWVVGVCHTKPYSVSIVSPLNPGQVHTYDSMMKVVVHEFTHAIVHRLSNGKRLPLWLDEGVALYEAGQAPSFHKKAIAKKSDLPSLSDLNSPTTDAQWNDVYRYSYTVVDYIIHEYGYEKLGDLIIGVGDIGTVLKMPVSEFQDDWHEFLIENYFN